MSVDAADFDQLEDWQLAILTLALVRRVKKFSQKQVAQSMGTVQSAVSELETLTTIPRINTFVRYAAALDFEVVIREQGAMGIESTQELADLIEDVVHRVTTGGSLLSLPEWVRRAATEGLQEAENAGWCFTCGRPLEED